MILDCILLVWAVVDGNSFWDGQNINEGRLCVKVNVKKRVSHLLFELLCRMQTFRWRLTDSLMGKILVTERSVNQPVKNGVFCI